MSTDIDKLRALHEAATPAPWTQEDDPTPPSGRGMTIVWDPVHRLLMGAAKGVFIDHINGDKLDNRRSNLRPATNQQNQINRMRLAKNNKSGFTGVTAAGKKWYAYYHKNGRVFRVGLFETKEEAFAARQAALTAEFGEFCPRIPHAG